MGQKWGGAPLGLLHNFGNKLQDSHIAHGLPFQTGNKRQQPLVELVGLFQI